MSILVIAMLSAPIVAIVLLLVGRESPNQISVLDMVKRMSLALRNSHVTHKFDAAAYKPVPARLSGHGRAEPARPLAS